MADADKPPDAAAQPETGLLSPQDRARELYMQHVPAADISRQLGVSLRQINRWRSEHDWALARETEDRSIIEEGFSSRKLTVAKVATLTLDQIKRGLEHLARRHESPTLQEAERLSTILANLDRLQRLDAGKSTENVALNAAVRMSVDEIKSIINSDPFGGTEE